MDDLYHNRYRIETARAWWHDYDAGAYFVTICTKNREHYFGEIEDGKMMLTEVGRYTTEQLKNISTHYPNTDIPLFTVMPNHIHVIIIVSPCRDVACNVSSRNNIDAVCRDVACNVSSSANPDVVCRDAACNVSSRNNIDAVCRYVARNVSSSNNIDVNQGNVARNNPDADHRDVARNVSTANETDVNHAEMVVSEQKNEYMSERSPKRGSLAVAIRGVKSAITRFANENDIEFAWQTRFHDHIVRDSDEMNRIATYVENNVSRWSEDEFYTPRKL